MCELLEWAGDTDIANLVFTKYKKQSVISGSGYQVKDVKPLTFWLTWKADVNR